MSRSKRLELLRMRLLQQFGENHRIARARVGDAHLLSDAERDWHELLTGFAFALVGMESRKRWAVCRSTERDYAATVVESVDGLLVQESKLLASGSSAGEVRP